MKNILFSPAFVKFISAADAIDSSAGLWYDQKPSEPLARLHPGGRRHSAEAGSIAAREDTSSYQDTAAAQKGWTVIPVNTGRR